MASAIDFTESFDVVIIGGGSVGAVFANRLREDRPHRVLLLEAGRVYAPNRHGVSHSTLNVVDGVRVNTGIAYLTDEVRKRENLTIR